MREAESCQLVVRVQRICTSAEAKRIGRMEDGTGMAGFGVFADCRLQVVGWFLPSSVLSQSARLLPRFGVGLAFGAFDAFGAFPGFQGLSVQCVHGCPLRAAWRQKAWKLEVTWKCPGREARTCCGCAVPGWAVVKRAVLLAQLCPENQRQTALEGVEGYRGRTGETVLSTENKSLYE